MVFKLANGTIIDPSRDPNPSLQLSESNPTTQDDSSRTHHSMFSFFHSHSHQTKPSPIFGLYIVQFAHPPKKTDRTPLEEEFSFKFGYPLGANTNAYLLYVQETVAMALRSKNIISYVAKYLPQYKTGYEIVAPSTVTAMAPVTTDPSKPTKLIVAVASLVDPTHAPEAAKCVEKWLSSSPDGLFVDPVHGHLKSLLKFSPESSRLVKVEIQSHIDDVKAVVSWLLEKQDVVSVEFAMDMKLI